jgi:hypothetical protein
MLYTHRRFMRFVVQADAKHEVHCIAWTLFESLSHELLSRTVTDLGMQSRQHERQCKPAPQRRALPLWCDSESLGVSCAQEQVQPQVSHARGSVIWWRPESARGVEEIPCRVFF